MIWGTVIVFRFFMVGSCERLPVWAPPPLPCWDVQPQLVQYFELLVALVASSGGIWPFCIVLCSTTCLTSWLS